MPQSTQQIYRSISKPKLSGGSTSSFTSYATSLAKKNNAAEDAIIDKQYEDGLISASTYKIQLQSRLSRNYLTPLQVVTLNDKVSKVDEDLVDSQVSNMAASGELTSEQVLTYEKAKLARIPQTDSTAYQKQDQKVQQLTDKVEREKRTATRVKENLRISQMPEDSSERLLEKAKLYEKLESQARIDGDNQSADSFATSKINYQQAAKRAGINDLITNTRLTNSQTPDGGLGNPDAGAGMGLYRSLTGVPGSSVSATGSQGSGAAPSGKTTGAPAISSPALKNAYEALDRGQKSIERLYASRADKQSLIETYRAAVSQATGDQKTQLTIALNNLEQDIAGIDNQIDITTSNLQDTVTRIQETQAKLAASSFSQEVRKNNQLFSTAESDLETEFARGKLTKDEYIQKGAILAAAKADFFSQASDGFAQFGNDSSADSYMQKASEMQRVNEQYQTIVQNPDDYEILHTEPGGKLTNITGKGMKPGDFALVNVRRLKDQGLFDTNYVKRGDKNYLIQYPGQKTDNEGFPLNKGITEDLAKLQDKSFIYRYENGKQIKEPVAFLKRTNAQTKEVYATPFFKNDQIIDGKKIEGLDTRVKRGAFIYDPKQGYVVKPTAQPSLMERQGIFVNPFDSANVESIKKSAPVTFINKAIEAGKKGASNFLGAVSRFIAPPVMADSGPKKPVVFNKATYKPPTEGKRVVGIEAEAKDLGGIPKEVVADVSEALKEQGIYSAQTLAYALATIKHETAGSFRPVNEGYYNDEKYGYDPGFTGKSEARKRGYGGGEDYYGRGYIQLTHDYNYQRYGDQLGIDLVNNPELANDPKIAAKILALYFKDRGTADLVKAGKAVQARGTINPDNKGQLIANAASNILRNLGKVVTPKSAYAKGVPLVGGMTQDEYIRSVRQATKTKASDTQLRSQFNLEVAKVQAAAKREAEENDSFSGPTVRTGEPYKQPSPVAQLRSVVSNSIPSIKMPSVPQVAMPKIQIPTIQQSIQNVQKTTAPVIRSVQKAAAPVIKSVQNTASNVVKSVQKAAAPVVNTVQKAIQNVGNFLNNLNPFKKK